MTGILDKAPKWEKMPTKTNVDQTNDTKSKIKSSLEKVLQKTSIPWIVLLCFMGLYVMMNELVRVPILKGNWQESQENLTLAMDTIVNNKKDMEHLNQNYHRGMERLISYETSLDAAENLDGDARNAKYHTMLEQRERFKNYADQYDRFDEDCVGLRAGHLESRFFHEDRCVSRSELRQIVIDMVHAATSEFEKHGIKYWLDGGTFLGALRHLTVIPSDEDADIGLLTEDMTKLRNTKFGFNETEYAFEIFESKVHPQGGRDPGIPGRLIHKGTGLYIDLFEYVDKVPDADGNLVVGPVPSCALTGCLRCVGPPGQMEMRMSKNWIFPTKDCEFAGKTVQCPRNATAYLDYIYGPDFMEPKPYDH